MIRFILVLIFLIVFLVFSYVLFLVEWVIGKIDPRAKDVSCLRIVQWAFRIILKISGVKVTVKGKERIPDEAVLFVGNHRSFFDILIVYTQCDRLTGFVAKNSMEKIPSLRVWMRYLYCLFLNRDNPREGMATILNAIDYVKKGISICIFPEGTRNTGEELSILPFKEGAMKIALKTGCPVIPVSINNAVAIFEKQFPKLRKTHVILEFGDPIYPGTLDKEECKHLGAMCQEIIQKTICENQKELRGN